MLTKRILPVAGLVAGTVLALSGAAFAGSCPADKIVADGQGQKPSAAAAKDVTDVVLGAIDLATQPVGVAGPPVPHAPPRDQARRRGSLAQPRRPPGADLRRRRRGHRVRQQLRGADRSFPGEVAEETKGTSHWWQNTGKTTAVLISADLLHQTDDAHMM